VFKDFDETPALEAAERSGLHDADAIANLGFVFLVVGMEFGNVFGDFPELWMRHTSDRADDNRLVALIGNNFSYACLAQCACAFRRGGRGFNSGGRFAHLLGRWCPGLLEAENGFDTGDVATQGTEHVRLLELSTLLLNPEVKDFFPELALAGDQFFGG